jgi:hypothetical protein
MRLGFTTAPSLIQKSNPSTKPPDKIKILNTKFIFLPGFKPDKLPGYKPDISDNHPGD